MDRILKLTNHDSIFLKKTIGHQYPPPKILAVDDDEDNLLLLISILDGLNYKSLTAKNGKTALFLAQTEQPDLILLDIVLPDINGWDVIAQLRRNPVTEKIPIVAVTALVSPKSKEKVKAEGGNDFIRKPYMIDHIESIINYHLVQSVSTSD
ncbi:MAG: response regulator [Chroococcales cyanobacterium]